MNKSLFILINVCTLAVQTLSAQKDTLPESETQSEYQHWSIQVSGGYGFPFLKDYIIREDHYNAQNSLTSTLKKGSLGEGILNVLSIEYRIKERIGFELGFFANWGKEIRTSHYSSDAFPDNFDDSWGRVNTTGLLVGFSISERFSKFQLGLHNYFMYGFYNKGYNKTRWGDANDDRTWVIEDSGNASFGWLTKLSISYSLNDHFSIGLDGFIMMQAWRPAEGEFVVNTYNGQDGLQYMAEEDKHITYSETYSGPTNPYIFATAFTYQLHSCGAGVRINYSF